VSHLRPPSNDPGKKRLHPPPPSSASTTNGRPSTIVNRPSSEATFPCFSLRFASFLPCSPSAFSQTGKRAVHYSYKQLPALRHVPPAPPDTESKVYTCCLQTPSPWEGVSLPISRLPPYFCFVASCISTHLDVSTLRVVASHRIASPRILQTRQQRNLTTTYIDLCCRYWYWRWYWSVHHLTLPCSPLHLQSQTNLDPAAGQPCPDWAISRPRPSSLVLLSTPPRPRTTAAVLGASTFASSSPSLPWPPTTQSTTSYPAASPPTAPPPLSTTNHELPLLPDHRHLAHALDHKRRRL
jgi:hypothetical protein